MSAREQAIRRMLVHPDRPAADRERDADRKPAETLTLAGIQAGMQVADLMAGSGWYTEVLARAVGPDGRVIAQNNSISGARFGEALRERVRASKLDNVVVLERELEALDLPAGSLDAVFMVWFYHDTYWQEVDRAAMNRGILEMLKPGGVFCLIDHRAEARSGSRDVKTLHRVDPDLVRAELLDAGFELDAESHLLRNADDDHSLSVFDPAIRGRTDQFFFLFRKPG